MGIKVPNPEIMAHWAQDTVLRQVKQQTQHRKLKR